MFAALKRPFLLAIVLANVAVFVLMVATGQDFDPISSPIVRDLAVRGVVVTQGDWLHSYTILTSAFLHASVLHILGNMLVLVFIGLPLEERIGRNRFLAIYLGGAVTAVLLHIAFEAASSPASLQNPLVGASGAVFGVLGAIAVLYPRVVVPVPLFILFVRLPAYVAAIVLSAIEVLLVYAGRADHVAHTAHIGGVLGGVLFGLALRPKDQAVLAKRAASRIDYSALERLAPEPSQKQMVNRIRESADEREVQRAWLDRFVRVAKCADCGQGFDRDRGGVLVCPQGHEARYVV